MKKLGIAKRELLIHTQIMRDHEHQRMPGEGAASEMTTLWAILCKRRMNK